MDTPLEFIKFTKLDIISKQINNKNLNEKNIEMNIETGSKESEKDQKGEETENINTQEENESNKFKIFKLTEEEWKEIYGEKEYPKHLYKNTSIPTSDKEIEMHQKFIEKMKQKEKEKKETKLNLQENIIENICLNLRYSPAL